MSTEAGAPREAGPGSRDASERPPDTLRPGEVPAGRVDCEHSISCAGCPLIDLDYGTQLQRKRQRVALAAAHYASLGEAAVRDVVPARAVVGYRGRAKLIVSPSGGIGLYSRTGNHQVTDIPGCHVLTPSIAAVVEALRALIKAPPAEGRMLLLPFDPQGGGVLRALDLREAEGPAEGPGADAPRTRVLLTFVLERSRAPSQDELAAAARVLRPMLPGVAGIAANLHDDGSPQVLGAETILLDGVGTAMDRIGESYHLASFGSFVQAHRDQAARVHGLLLREIAALAKGARSEGKGPRVLDLYGGSGAIGIALARAGCDVTLVESFPPATQAARAAAEAQGLSLRVRTGDVAETAEALAAAGERFDAVVVNPPRRGVSPTARDAVARLGAPLLLYVSCDPDSLTRDLDHLARLGYAADELQPLDMIPLTEEVETVCALRPAPPPAPTVIFEDDDLLVVEKAAHEPIGPLPEYFGSLLGRIARSGLAPEDADLRPLHRLDPGVSGICVLAKGEAAGAAWGQAMATSGRLIYLAAARGITPAKGAVTRDLREGQRMLPARTRYRRLAVAGGHSVLRVLPDGERTHQVRRHLAAIGHPVLGDERYGHMPTNRHFEEKHGLDRSFVHLVRIEVTDPRSGQRLLLESTLAGDLRATLERANGASVLRFLEGKNALGDVRASTMPPPPVGEDAPPSSRLLYDDPVLATRYGRSGPSSMPPPSRAPSSIAPASMAPSIPFSRRGEEGETPEPPPSRELAPDVDEAPRTRRFQSPIDDD